MVLRNELQSETNFVISSTTGSCRYPSETITMLKHEVLGRCPRASSGRERRRHVAPFHPLRLPVDGTIVKLIVLGSSTFPARSTDQNSRVCFPVAFTRIASPSF